MTDISRLKKEARKAAFVIRKTAHAQGLDADANRNLLGQLALYRDVNVISAYMPIRTEVSPLSTMTILHGQGKQICVPVIQGPEKPLLFREWAPDAVMIDGPFGAAVPESGALLMPDVLITPLLSFDSECYRLGYGGGFYDRSFEQLGQYKKVVGLGFAYSQQQVAHVPRNATDHQLDAVVTETAVIAR